MVVLQAIKSEERKQMQTIIQNWVLVYHKNFLYAILKLVVGMWQNVKKFNIFLKHST